MRTILRFVAGASLAVMIPVLVGVCLSLGEARANAIPVVTNCYTQCQCLLNVNTGTWVCTASAVSGCSTTCACYWKFYPSSNTWKRKCQVNP